MKHFSCSHPSLWVAIEKLREYDSEVTLKIAHHSTGRMPGRKRMTKWVQVDQRRIAILANYCSANAYAIAKDVGNIR
jgi:hypothetical protein